LIYLYFLFILFNIEDGIYCELNQSKCITYIISPCNNKNHLKVLEDSIKNLSPLIKPITSCFSSLLIIPLHKLDYGYLACSRKYYMTRKVSLFILKNNNNNIDDDNNDKIEINMNIINEISAETVMF